MPTLTSPHAFPLSCHGEDLADEASPVFVRTAAISSEPSAWSTELPQPQGLSSDGLIRLLQLQLEEQSSLCRAAEARSKERMQEAKAAIELSEALTEENNVLREVLASLQAEVSQLRQLAASATPRPLSSRPEVLQRKGTTAHGTPGQHHLRSSLNSLPSLSPAAAAPTTSRTAAPSRDEVSATAKAKLMSHALSTPIPTLTPVVLQPSPMSVQRGPYSPSHTSHPQCDLTHDSHTPAVKSSPLVPHLTLSVSQRIAAALESQSQDSNRTSSSSSRSSNRGVHAAVQEDDSCTAQVSPTPHHSTTSTARGRGTFSTGTLRGTPPSVKAASQVHTRPSQPVPSLPTAMGSLGGGGAACLAAQLQSAMQEGAVQRARAAALEAACRQLREELASAQALLSKAAAMPAASQPQAPAKSDVACTPPSAAKAGAITITPSPCPSSHSSGASPADISSDTSKKGVQQPSSTRSPHHNTRKARSPFAGGDKAGSQQQQRSEGGDDSVRMSDQGHNGVSGAMEQVSKSEKQETRLHLRNGLASTALPALHTIGSPAMLCQACLRASRGNSSAGALDSPDGVYRGASLRDSFAGSSSHTSSPAAGGASPGAQGSLLSAASPSMRRHTSGAHSPASGWSLGAAAAEALGREGSASLGASSSSSQGGLGDGLRCASGLLDKLCAVPELPEERVAGLAAALKAAGAVPVEYDVNWARRRSLAAGAGAAGGVSVDGRGFC